MAIERHPIDLETRREEWLALRRQDVTASDIAVVCGCHPHKSAMRLWAEKTGEIGEAEDNAAMRRGRYMEAAVLNACRGETDWLSLYQPNVYLRDPELRIGATPDAVGTDSNGEFIVQCKVVARPIFERWEGEPPLHYQLQTLTEAMLWGAPRAVLAVYVQSTFATDNDLVLYPIERNAGAEAKIKAAVARFWDEIEAGEAPTADYSRDADVIRRLFPPRDNVEPVDFSRDNYMAELLHEREGLKAAVKTAETRLEAIDAEIIMKLNGATAGQCDDWRIKHVMAHRKAYVVPEKSYPSLRINKLKETTP